MKFKDFYEAWNYLTTTEVFWHKNTEEKLKGLCRYDDGTLHSNHFIKVLDIDVVKVNPENNTIEEDTNLNTKTQIWLESGEPYTNKELRQEAVLKLDLDCEDTEEVLFNSHNYNYDSGGNTFEEAIIEMANLVYKYNEGGN